MKDTKELKWDKLDNTAHVFPVIAGEKMSNVYRISVVLKEEVKEEYLQKALEEVLPQFPGFHVRLRTGAFWYYFEENNKPAPRVHEENTYPCRYILQQRNNSYLFRVTYFGPRINLEVFHVLTDGMGGVGFIKELVYHYLSLVHVELEGERHDSLQEGTSLDREDSFLENYKTPKKSGYHSEHAYLLKGEQLIPGEFGVIHGYIPIEQLKEVCHRYQMSINEYLVSAFAWGIYKENMRGIPNKRAIRIAVPVNLRPYFQSVTTKNFFVMVSAEFLAVKESYSFEEVASEVVENLRKQINKEHLEEIFSYNVTNEKHLVAQMVPLFLKNLAIRTVYRRAALANTSTVTNIGQVSIDEKYDPYVEMVHAYLAMSEGQMLKGTICSYKDTLVFSFSSVLASAKIQRGFFRQLVSDGIEVIVESNGVYNE